ncbi:MAG TPA: DUF465 domain-containing protein [Candidatus Aquilonibacter sp.]|nr:DUF465 domain-containing protein [Candidatus Aquilonibacter sp.]
MPASIHDIRQSLFMQDPEFRSLAEEHSRCENRLEEILSSSYLSSEDLLQEAKLKKIKLRLKDQMESIVARYRNLSH